MIDAEKEILSRQTSNGMEDTEGSAKPKGCRDKKTLKQELKELGLGVGLMLTGVFVFAAGQYAYDRYHLFQNADYMTENTKKYSNNYLGCFNRKAPIMAQKDQSDIYVLSEEMIDLCKMEVNAYRGFVVETLGSMGFYGWPLIRDDIKKEAADTILMVRRIPKIKVVR